MCGIAGILDFSSSFDLDKTIKAMTNSLAHRGPDGEGYVRNKNVALGHRRLAIIDLQGGHQPMHSDDGLITLTYNGEIYNYKSLKQELLRKGRKFRTNSDTEVVLRSYEEWGRHCTERFDGMFAFAIADFRKRELLLARDHFGIKPLLYRANLRNFSFASELPPFYQLPDWTSEIDLYSLDLYLRYQYIPAPQTIYREVRKLPAGHRLVVKMDDKSQFLEKYWQPDFRRRNRSRHRDILDELDHCLRDSVKRHLVADVPFGALLSGGIDSSLVVSYIAENQGHQFKTFSIGFNEEDTNELDYARIVSNKYGTEHHEEIIKFDALENLSEIVHSHGEPFGDQSTIPSWAVCKLARSKVPMVLSGDGGDEFFAGYNWYGSWLHNNPITKTQTSLRSFLSPLKRQKLKPTLPPPNYGIASKWLQNVERFRYTDRNSLWRPELRFLTDIYMDVHNLNIAQNTCQDSIDYAIAADLSTYLPENILTKVDIASMHYGLEVRPPILDKHVFNLAASIPQEQLFDISTDASGFNGKLPLKQLCARKIGRDFAFRPKKGFVLPLSRWVGHGSKHYNTVKSLLTCTSNSLSDWFDLTNLEKNFEKLTPENIWMLLCLEEWNKQNKAMHR